jgi:hypothetical protein
MRRHAALLCLALAGCASGFVPGITPATAEQVQSCRYLDTVIGSSGLYGYFGSAGADNARSEAMERAQALGATHVVWQDRSASYGSTSVAAKAYRCS